MTGVREVLVPTARLEPWLRNFAGSHGTPVLVVGAGRLCGTAPDGSTFAASAPFGREVAVADLDGLVAQCAPPADWGVLLVRKGGFAVARLEDDRIVDSKVGRRHVQGRTKAGGQSQQRFARRRDNQARAAYDAAAGHASRILAGAPGLVRGGDHVAVRAVLDAMGFPGMVWEPWLAVPDPRRGVLERAVVDAGSVRMSVANAG